MRNRRQSQIWIISGSCTCIFHILASEVISAGNPVALCNTSQWSSSLHTVHTAEHGVQNLGQRRNVFSTSALQGQVLIGGLRSSCLNPYSLREEVLSTGCELFSTQVIGANQANLTISNCRRGSTFGEAQINALLKRATFWEIRVHCALIKWGQWTWSQMD